MLIPSAPLRSAHLFFLYPRYSATHALSLEEALAPHGIVPASFDAVIAVGVLSYVEQFDVLFSECARAVAPGGVVAFTHIGDWWDEDKRGCRSAAEALVASGAWACEEVGAPEAYMPNNPDPVEQAKMIRIMVYRRPGEEAKA